MEAELRAVTELFEKVGAQKTKPKAKKADGDVEDDEDGDNDEWERRFKEFTDEVKADHSRRLESVKQLPESEREHAEKREVWRARQEIYGIVQQRIDSINTDDPSTAKSMLEIKSQIRDAQAKISDEILSTPMPQASTPSSPVSPKGSISSPTRSTGPTSPSSPNGFPTGASAFAAARRKASDSSSHGGYSSSGNDATLNLMKRSDTTTLSRIHEDSSPGSPSSPTRPNLERAKSTSELIWGTSNATMRGGPAALGPGPQKNSLTPPPPVVNHTYSSLHKRALEMKHGGKEVQHGGGFQARPVKDLTLRQLRDIIHSVYQSKAKFDQQCKAQGEALETMEQHFYGFLGKRYGLKSTIQEWASATYRGIGKYAPENADVAVFGKILQNSLAESFPEVQDSIRQTSQLLMRQQLEQKNPFKSQSEIEALLKSRTRSGIPLSDCTEVVQYMYNDDDAEEIMRRVNYASKHSTDVNGEPLAANTLALKDMMQVLLAFQMGLTESFLRDFVRIFSEIDWRGEGRLDFVQLEELVRRLASVDGSEDDASTESLLMEAKATASAAVKRYRKGATFSQCVDLLTGLISARWSATSSIKHA